MKIDIIVNDGSPVGVTSKSIYGEDGSIGVGGSELGLLTMCETWAELGHEICLYNDPKELNASPFEQLRIGEFVPSDDRDVVIIFRSPNKRLKDAKGMKVWWSTDQYTIGDFREFAKKVDKIVVISDFHRAYFDRMYGIKDVEVIDLPVRLGDYLNPPKQVPGRCIFTSVPDRGLNILNNVWPRIKGEFPSASLVITSDYRLWGLPTPKNEKFRIHWSHYENADNGGVSFLGAVPRKRLVEEEMKAQVLTYPCIYDELFCVSVAEAQVAGVYPVTSKFGALNTTNMGTALGGDPRQPGWSDNFVEAVVDALHMIDEHGSDEEVRDMAISRFSPFAVAKQWQTKIFGSEIW